MPHIVTRASSVKEPWSQCIYLTTARSRHTNTRPYQMGDFRLLRIEPGQGEDPLEGTLITARLSNPNFYIAISYVWGSSTKPFSIWTEGGTLPITASLRTALRYIRDKQVPVVIWADAVCT
jgi:hypothetical protein